MGGTELVFFTRHPFSVLAPAETDPVAAWGIAYDFLDKTNGRLVCKIDS